MMILRRVRVPEFQRGLLFRDGDLVEVLMPGRHWRLDPLLRCKVVTLSVRRTWLEHTDLDVIVRSGLLADELQVIDLADHERALVRIDGRLDRVLGPGLYALWTVFHRVDIEILDARQQRVRRPDLPLILEKAGDLMNSYQVQSGQVAMLFLDGRFEQELGSGLHGFWKSQGHVQILNVDLREIVDDVAGQEIMTADKVTLRLNAVVTWRVRDPLRAVTEVEDYRQALYREAQLALRAVIGTRSLDALLSEKDEVATELRKAMQAAVESFGVEVGAVGIRDVILPGDMKELMNRVTEARKASEAALITRREETAAMRSQANTARLLESSPTLMRLRELEVLEKVAEKANLQVILGGEGLTDRVTKLL